MDNSTVTVSDSGYLRDGYPQEMRRSHGGFFAQHNIENISNDGTNHVYEILSSGSNNIWYIYYDYVYQGYSSVQPSNTAILTLSGLELYDGQDSDGGRIDSDDFGNTFNNYTQAQSELRFLVL